MICITRPSIIWTDQSWIDSAISSSTECSFITPVISSSLLLITSISDLWLFVSGSVIRFGSGWMILRFGLEVMRVIGSFICLIIYHIWICNKIVFGNKYKYLSMLQSLFTLSSCTKIQFINIVEWHLMSVSCKDYKLFI